MKRYLVLIFIVSNFTFLRAQFANNKLNVGIGVSAVIPLNHNTIRTDYFNYPSLYGNYVLGTSGIFTIDYNLKNNLWINFEISKNYYGGWSGDKELFILKDPTINLSVYSIALTPYPERFQPKNTPIYWGFFVAPVIAVQKLSWTGINQYTDDDYKFPNTEKIKMPGFRGGIELSLLNINSLGIYSKAFYQYLYCNSNYYNDKAFHSVNFSIIIKYKLLKNRYFNYE